MTINAEGFVFPSPATRSQPQPPFLSLNEWGFSGWFPGARFSREDYETRAAVKLNTRRQRRRLGDFALEKRAFTNPFGIRLYATY
jgi:hypothetical protein